LKIAELKIEQHEKLHRETQESIKTLTDGINKLIQAEIRREQDDDTFKRIFSEIAELREAHQKFKDQQAEKELAAYKGIVLKFFGLSALIIASMLAGHFGIHLIG
jgi:hypothetical protein